MTSRAEITSRYAKAYKAASKRDRGRLLDEVVSVTGWSRDNARRRLTAAAATDPGKGREVGVVPRRRRASRYSYDALKVLQRVWAAPGGQCGKYLAASMPLLVDSLEEHGELIVGQDRYSVEVRRELLAMSAATIDRYLTGARNADPLRGIATTKASPLLRSSITIRKAGDEVEAEPGFFEGDTVAHCGPTIKGEYARTVNLTCVHTGWVFTRAVRNNAHVHVLGALQAAVAEIPFEVLGLDFDNGREFLNQAVIEWAAGRQIYFTRSRPYKKNDQATIESKNNHLVRRYGFYYRYDTPAELRVLNRLWSTTGSTTSHRPRSPSAGTPTATASDAGSTTSRPHHSIDCSVPESYHQHKKQELLDHRALLNPADLARRIHDEQSMLTKLSKDKTDQLRETTIKTSTRLPRTDRGVRLREPS